MFINLSNILPLMHAVGCDWSHLFYQVNGKYSVGDSAGTDNLCSDWSRHISSMSVKI